MIEIRSEVECRNAKLSYMIILRFCFPRSGGGFLVEEPRSV